MKIATLLTDAFTEHLMQERKEMKIDFTLHITLPYNIYITPCSQIHVILSWASNKILDIVQILQREKKLKNSGAILLG